MKASTAAEVSAGVLCRVRVVLAIGASCFGRETTA